MVIHLVWDMNWWCFMMFFAVNICFFKGETMNEVPYFWDVLKSLILNEGANYPKDIPAEQWILGWERHDRYILVLVWKTQSWWYFEVNNHLKHAGFYSIAIMHDISMHTLHAPCVVYFWHWWNPQYLTRNTVDTVGFPFNQPSDAINKNPQYTKVSIGGFYWVPLQYTNKHMDSPPFVNQFRTPMDS